MRIYMDRIEKTEKRKSHFRKKNIKFNRKKTYHNIYDLLCN